MRILRRVLLALVLVGVGCLWRASPAPAQGAAVWTNLGLYGGQIYDIAIDPLNPDKMFAGGYMGDGLFVTTDGGTTWRAVQASNSPPGEGTFRNHAVYAVEIAPSDNRVIWAAHNYWVEKSTDGGQTWTHILNGAMQRTCTKCPPSGDQFRFCRSLAIDPVSADTVYVGTGGPNGTISPGAIYKTVDGGKSWTKLNNGNNFDYGIADVAIDPQDSRVIWAVTSSGGAGGWKGTLYRSANGGDAWDSIMTIDGGFEKVAVKPTDSNTVFTGSGFGIIKHYFDGTQWQFLWPVISESALVHAICFDSQDPEVMYAAWRNSFSGDSLPRVARSRNGGIDWEIYTVNYEFLTLAVRPSVDPLLRDVFGGELFKGVFKSQDQGQSWTAINNGINALLVYDVDVDPHDSSHLLVATTAGVYEKRGAGDWVRTSDFVYTLAQAVAFDPSDSTGSTYYAGTQNYLAKTTNNGSTWTFSDALTQQFIGDIAIGPGGAPVFAAAKDVGVSGGGIYKNDDGLATPTVTQVLSSSQFDFNVVAIDPNDPNHVFAGSGNYYAPMSLGNLYESKAGGNAGTWQLTGLTGVVVNALLIDPRNSSVMYAGCGYSGGTDAPVYKSADGGVTWTPVFDGIPGGGNTFLGVWGTSGTDIFVCGQYGRVYHYDGGVWAPIRSGTLNLLYYLWGSSGRDVFAVGDLGTILRYDGSTWSAMASGTTQRLRSLWGRSGTDVFAVGNAGTLLHYNGTGWNNIDIASLTTQHLFSVWGSSGGHLFVAGDAGTILHYDGSGWSVMTSGINQYILGLWGTSETNVFAVGQSGLILHYDGVSWTPMTSGTSNDLQGVWGSSATDVFAVGANGTILHYDGSGWTAMSSGSTNYIWRIWGSSDRDVYAVDGGGQILHYDGSAWTGVLPPGKPWNSVTDMKFHPTNKSVVYASTTSQGVYVSPNEGKQWLNLGTPDYDVNAISTSSLYGATQGGLYQCTGTGVIAGKVTDFTSQTGIDGAQVSTDFGTRTVSVKGEYMMVSPSGTFALSATAAGYGSATYPGTVVHGGDVTWVEMLMARLGPSLPSVPQPTLVGITVSGPESVQENSDASYTATATFSDGSTQDVATQASWSEDSPSASISGGRLTTTEVSGNQTVTVTASYTKGGVTKSGSKTVTIVDVPALPVVGIRANGSDGPLTLFSGDNLIITVTLDNKGRSDDADWWVAAATPFGVYFYTFQGWTGNLQPVGQAALFYLDSFEVLNIPASALPSGSYTFYFGVDTVMDGKLTVDHLYFHSVQVNISK